MCIFLARARPDSSEACVWIAGAWPREMRKRCVNRCSMTENRLYAPKFSVVYLLTIGNGEKAGELSQLWRDNNIYMVSHRHDGSSC
jgi:hypothetical protein